MSTEKLYTVFLTFSDHATGVGQYATESPEIALHEFIKSNESLEGYDRNLLLKSLMPFTHLAKDKGVWLFHFNPDLMENEWPGDNPVLGGHIVQTDVKAESR